MASKEQILFVDDDPDTRSLYDHQFSAFGYDVLMANDGPLALEIYNKHLTPVAVIDAILPSAVSSGLNGFAVSARIRDINPSAIIIIATGLPNDAQTKVRILDSKADKILIKPVTPLELLSEIRYIQAKREAVKPRALRAPGSSRMIVIGFAILLGLLISGLSGIGLYDWHCNVVLRERQDVADRANTELIKSLFAQQQINDKTRQDDKYAELDRRMHDVESSTNALWIDNRNIWGVLSSHGMNKPKGGKSLCSCCPG